MKLTKYTRKFNKKYDFLDNNDIKYKDFINSIFLHMVIKN